MTGISEIDRVIVSTDCDEIGQCAEKYGVAYPFKRPQALSGDYVGDFDVIYDSFFKAEEFFGTKFDYVILLQPTCPLRIKDDIIYSLNHIFNFNFSSVWTVSETDLKYHPLKQLKGSESGHLNLFHPQGQSIVARQQLETTFTRNGACYILSRDCVIRKLGMLNNNTGFVVINRSLVSIDTIDDFKLVETILIRNE